MIHEATKTKVVETIARESRRYGLSTHQAKQLADSVLAVLATAPAPTIVVPRESSATVLDALKDFTVKPADPEPPKPAEPLPVPSPAKGAAFDYYWIVEEGATVTVDTPELQAKIDAGYKGPIQRTSDTEWRDAAYYKLVANPKAAAPKPAAVPEERHHDPSDFKRYPPVGLSLTGGGGFSQ